MVGPQRRRLASALAVRHHRCIEAGLLENSARHEEVCCDRYVPREPSLGKPMIGSLAVLLLFQLAGELIVRLGGLPVPGPVVGMILLFFALLLRGAAPKVFTDTSRQLLAYLTLLFVPAGVGIVAHLGRVADQWLQIVITLVASTALTMIVTALTLRALAARRSE